MRNLLRYLGADKRKQDESGPKEITPADRVRAARAVQASDSAKARARFEQKSRDEEAVGVPSEPNPARVNPPTAPQERSPALPANSVDKSATSIRQSESKEFSGHALILIRGFVLVVGVLQIAQAFFFGTIQNTVPGTGGGKVVFADSPISFLFELAFALVMVGWGIAPLLRKIMPDDDHIRG